MFTNECAAYAAKLQAAGFTVYAPTRQARGTVSWFHYSRDVDGQTCYGTFTDGSDGFDGPDHSMPIPPSRLNGSGARIGAGRHLSPMSVEMAELVARPSNYCPFNYPETAENIRRANAMRPLPARAATGTTLRNATPWGIGTNYAPVVPA